MRRRKKISIIILTSVIFLAIAFSSVNTQAGRTCGISASSEKTEVSTEKAEASAETTEVKQEEPARKSTPYDDITWDDVYAKRGKGRSDNPYQNLFSFMYRERKIESATGEDVTVVETATYSDSDTVVAPVVVVDPD